MTLRLIGIIATSIGSIILAAEFIIVFNDLQKKIAKKISIKEDDINRLLSLEGGIIVLVGFIVFFISY